MRRWAALAGFVVLVVGGGAGIGMATGPGEWYASLTRPAFAPPNWVFGPVWTALYVLIAVAGWRVWQQGSNRRLVKLWWTLIILNFVWSPVFFGLHRIDWALLVILLLWATIATFIGIARRRDPVSAWLFVPYAAWVGFAAVLNAAFLVLN